MRGGRMNGPWRIGASERECIAVPLHQEIVEQGQLDLMHVQADEIRVKGCKMVAWMGLAMMVSTDALLRVVRAEQNAILRTRDEALLALLIYAGLRVQEACDLQLRDLDVGSGTITVLGIDCTALSGVSLL